MKEREKLPSRITGRKEMPRSLKIEESEHPADAYLDFSSDKETSYADELQS